MEVKRKIMRMQFLLLLLMALGYSLQAQTENPAFNQNLADSLGADEYGMKSYIFVILKTGSNQIKDKEQVTKLFRGHLENINRLAALKKLVVAGPFMQNENSYRGLFIFDVKSKAEAEALLATDPAIQEQLLEAELYEWYGSAALPVYLETSKKIARKNP